MEKKCWSCGEVLDSRARFCHYCGKSASGEAQKTEFLTSDIPSRKKVELQCVGSETHERTDLSGIGTDITGAIRDDIDKYLNPDLVLQPMVMRKADQQRLSQRSSEEYREKGENFAFSDKSQSVASYAPIRDIKSLEKGSYQYYEEQYKRMRISKEKPHKDKIVIVTLILGILSIGLVWIPVLPIIISVFALLIGTKSKDKSSARKLSRFINTAGLIAGAFVLASYISGGGI